LQFVGDYIVWSSIAEGSKYAEQTYRDSKVGKENKIDRSINQSISQSVGATSSFIVN